MTNSSDPNPDPYYLNFDNMPRQPPRDTPEYRDSLAKALYGRVDYFPPGENQASHDFWHGLHLELNPEGILERVIANEVAGAAWRLRRCSLAEGDLSMGCPTDPFLDEKTEKPRQAIYRARSAANRNLHRNLNQLRKLQTDRQIGFELSGVKERHGIADMKAVLTARKSAPNCKTGHAATAASVSAPEIGRNAQCPCHSGQKYKRCCGRNSPPLLNRGLNKAA